MLKAEQFWEHPGIPKTPIRAGNSKAKLKILIVKHETLLELGCYFRDKNAYFKHIMYSELPRDKKT